MLHDVKHAFRMLMHSKGWTLVVLLSLAIGIGATTALFTAVNGLLLHVVSGLVGALAGGRYIESVLYGLTTTDAWTISTAIGATVLVSLAAGYLPARRASLVDPMVALRYE